MQKDYQNEDELFEAAAKAWEQERDAQAASTETSATAPKEPEPSTSSMASMFKSALDKNPSKVNVSEILQDK